MVKLQLPKIYAGFANKLFVLMTAMSYKKKYGCEIYGYKKDFPEYLQKFIKQIESYCYNIYDVDTVNTIKEQNSDFILYGYCQNYNFIDKKYCQELFKCPMDVFIKIQELYGDISNKICLHIRRGDYLYKENQDKYISYSKQDIETIIKQYYPNDEIICISDDINWCKENLCNLNITFADKSDDCLVDFYIQTLTKGNICSASSYSMAGAILNPNNNGVVVYPYYKNGDSLIVPSYIKRYEKI